MSFARALFAVSSLTIISRVAGFVRDTLTAVFLGAGPIADAFFVAMRLPNLFRTLFAEGAFSAAFVPLYAAEQQNHGKSAAQQFAGQALAILLAILIPFSILMMIFMPLVIRMLAPGFEDDPDKYSLTVRFSLITFPYLALISVTALQGGVLNAQNKFWAAAAAPIALNVVMIAALLLARALGWHVGYALSWAFTLSGVVQMMLLVISCRVTGVPIPIMAPRFSAHSRLLFKRIGPGAIGAGASQINMLLSTILASTLPTGTVACLSYADRLDQLPQGIVGIAVATTLLPILTRHVQAGEEDRARHFVSRAIEFCILLGMPATIGFVLAAKPIVQTLFEHGAFGSQDTIMTAEILAAYALGIPAFLLVKVFSAGFFARHDTTTPVRIALVAMMTNVICALLLLGPLKHIGIALASTIAVWTNAVLLFARLHRKKAQLSDEKLRFRMPRLLLCALGMSLVTAALLYVTQSWFEGHDTWHEIMGLAVIIGLSGLVYAVMLQLTGAMRLKEALGILKRKPDNDNVGSLEQGS
jgi:putative peptidoglycan lipid II flippase